jgi:hypothetical protein
MPEKMDIERLIEIAFSRTPTVADVEEAATFERLPIETALDAFARRVAVRYLEGVYNFGDADVAMSNLFAWSTVVTGTALPEFAGKVFEAFDAGEFIRPGTSEDQQGEALTRTLLAVCLRPEP